MKELMHKYRDLPIDLADAALVRVAERERLRRIFTLDRRVLDRITDIVPPKKRSGYCRGIAAIHRSS